MNESIGWAAVGLAAITMLKGVTSDWVSRTTAKDKLEYDVKLRLLEVAQARCIEDHKECRDEAAKLHGRINDLQTQMTPVVPTPAST